MDAACRYRRRRHLSVLTSTSPGHASACSARRERHAVRAVTVDSRTARSAAHSLAYVLAVEGSKPASTQREPQDYRHTYTCRPPRLRILYACFECSLAAWPARGRRGLRRQHAGRAAGRPPVRRATRRSDLSRARVDGHLHARMHTVPCTVYALVRSEERRRRCPPRSRSSRGPD